MTYKEEITKLIRASYDQGAKDAQQETLAALEQIVAAARADEREAVIGLLKGIDKTEIESADGWWETSSGAEFGAGVLDAIRARSNT